MKTAEPSVIVYYCAETDRMEQLTQKAFDRISAHLHSLARFKEDIRDATGSYEIRRLKIIGESPAE